MSRDQVILRAYIDTDALKRPCSTCGAQVNQWCCTPDDRIRKVPCVARAVTGGILPESILESDVRDFSQPTHEKAAQ